ncbi:unnamed protein product [Psylliodes chrysocephalus]|uniref:Uncharacterized protein n=1 Tax=Psylliodes chrysocephalus TaxID=3402493 RepID=A0A9P0CK55_9CUCU|nr:unnamed protein product [Psylliodes chrysocephala]
MRIMVHILQAVRDRDENTCILSSETDIIIMALYHFRTFEAPEIKELWIKVGAGVTKRDVPLYVIAVRCGRKTCSVLPALYHLTGADYTSKVWTKHAPSHVEPQNHLSSFVPISLSNTEIKKSIGDAEEYLVKVLRKNTSCKMFNELRFGCIITKIVFL